MILIELIWWLCDHWQDVTLSGVIVFLGRKLVMREAKKLLFRAGNEEITWIRTKVEILAGEKWTGPTKPSWKTVRKNFDPWLTSSQAVIRRANQLRGKKKMERLRSRKLWTFILLVILNGLNETLQLNLSHETITNVSALGGGYILVQGIIDIVQAFVNKQPKGEDVNAGHTNSLGSNK